MSVSEATALAPRKGEQTSIVPPMSAVEAEFPGVALSRIAERESWRKEVHRPATSTHKWWAKRLGSIFRCILAAAVTESEANAIDAYNKGIDLADITVFDPFAGSGITIVEAAKLGARVIGWDINPVATLVQRQAIQRWSPAELDRAFEALEFACRSEIDRVHRTANGEQVLYYFWVAVADCPSCSTPARLFSSHVFAQNAYPKRVPAAHLVCPICLDVVRGTYDFERAICSNRHQFSRHGTVTRGRMTCSNGHTSSILDALDGQAPRYDMYAKLVLGSDGKKRYESIVDFDLKLYDECVQLLARSERDLVLPHGWLDDGENTRQAIRWGFREWSQFFNARQLYSLGLLGAAIRDLDAAPAEREALAALFSGTLEFNNMFCSFKGEGTGAVRHMFSHHVLKPERTPLEAHPWGTPASSGSFSTLFESRLRRALAYKENPADQILRNEHVQRVHGVSSALGARIVDCWSDFVDDTDVIYLRSGDSSHTDLPDESVDLVITDPPYMDNVHYSELADFFHSWLTQLRPYDLYPAQLATTRNAREVQSTSPSEFEAAIAGVWRECSRVLKDAGLLAFTFHQARVAGWAALVTALADANLVVTAVQPVKGEMSTSSTKSGKEPSNLDSIVVCRKRDAVDVSPLNDPQAAAILGSERLAALKDAGIQVGAGDVRSVVRGHVLATYTADPTGTDISTLTALADRLATDCVAAYVP